MQLRGYHENKLRQQNHTTRKVAHMHKCTCTKCHENLLFRLGGLDFSMKVKIWLNFSRYSLRIPKGTLRFSSVKNIMTSMKKERTLSRFAESRIQLTIPSLSVAFLFLLKNSFRSECLVSIGPCFACFQHNSRSNEKYLSLNVFISYKIVEIDIWIIDYCVYKCII